MSKVNPSTDLRVFHQGARRRAREIARKLIPAMPVPDPGEEFVKREAYQLAVANRHKPWARRYLKEIARGFYAK